MGWKDKIIDPQATTSSLFGGLTINKILDYFSAVDLTSGGSEPGENADIITETIFANETLKLWDSNKTHKIIFQTPDYTENKTLTFPSQSTIGATDEIMFKDAAQIVTGKTIDFTTDNTAQNIPTTALPSSLLYNTDDINLGAHYLDIVDISTPSNPAATVRRIFKSTTTGKLSVIKSDGTVLSLEEGNLSQAGGFAAGGISTQSGAGGATFNIAHGLGDTPDVVTVVPTSTDAAEFGFLIEKDATNITIVYNTAPNTATDNLSWYWGAGYVNPDVLNFTDTSTNTLSNKTLSATDNTITDTSIVTGDLFKSNGTKFVRFAKGTGLQQLRTNSGATDIEWFTPSGETWDPTSTETFENKTIDAALNTTIVRESNATLLIYIDAADSNICKVKKMSTGVVTRASADSTATNVTSIINTALTVDLTGGRTSKERVAFQGNFSITKITIPSYTTIDLTGAKITQADATDDHLFVNNDTTSGNTQIEIVGGFIDGNRANQTEDPDYSIHNAICMVKVTDLRIHNVHEENSNANGIFIDSTSSQIEITNCFIKGCAKIGIYIRSTSADQSSKARIANCYIDSPDENFFIVERCEDTIFEHNTCYNSGTIGISIMGRRTIIDANTLDTCATSMIALGVEGGAGSENWLGDGSRITNNIMRNIEQYGISVGINTSCVDVHISGNIMSPNGTTTSANSVGVRLVGALRCHVINNRISGFQRNGIRLDGATTSWSCSYNIISGNIVNDCGKDTGAAAELRSGIYVTADTLGFAVGNTISNNICYDTAGAGGTQQYGLAIKRTTDITISGNHLDNNVLGAILDLVLHSPSYQSPALGFNRGHGIQDSHWPILPRPAVSPLVGWKRVGIIYPGSAATGLPQGAFNGMPVTAGTFSWFIDSDGIGNTLQSATSGVSLGIYSTANATGTGTRRELNAYMKILCAVSPTTNSRLYMGFSTAVASTGPPVSDTVLANGDSGVFVGYNTATANYSVWNNDGTGAMVTNTFGAGIAKDTAYHVFEIQMSSSNIVCKLDGGNTVTLTTRIPATNADLYVHPVSHQLSTSSTHTLYMLAGYFRSDK